MQRRGAGASGKIGATGSRCEEVGTTHRETHEGFIGKETTDSKYETRCMPTKKKTLPSSLKLEYISSTDVYCAKK